MSRHPHFSLFHHVPFALPALRASLLGLCLVAVGCGDGADNVADQPPIIPSVTNVSVGDPTCPTGGVRVQVGADDNQDGDLDADEVDQTSYVCNGTDMVGGEDDVLVRTVNLDPGVECVAGGRRLDIGLDNGDGTGLPSNGTLEDDEVDTSFLDCNGTMAVVVAPPTGSVGTFVFDTHGGSGTTGSGGHAGSLRESADAGLVNSYLMLANTGSVDASCTVPNITVDLGGVPAIFTTTTTVAIVAAADEAALPNGTVFGRAGDTGLYVWDATNMVANRVTGLRVAAGATVTLSINNAYTSEGVGLYFERDVDIAGTLTTTAGATRRGILDINARQVRLAATSSVQTGGAADQDSGNVYFSAEQDLIALGAISTVGSSGASGRSGGEVGLSADGALYAGGTITTQGGVATGGAGGHGGSVYLEAESRVICTSADITTDGGAADGDAGDAGDIRLGRDCLYGIPVEIRNSGDLRARGGAEAGDCDETCSGGEGGRIDIVTGGSGGVASSGALDTRGGSSANGTGGAGETISIRQGFAFEPTVTVVRYDVTGNVTTFGGDGATGGGHGGDVYMANVGALGSASRFLGYASALLDGGDGAVQGAGGGSIVFEPEMDDTEGGLGLFVHTNVSATGGTGGTERGGDGGSIRFSPTIYDQVGVSGAPAQNFVVEGTIDLRAGNGAQGGTGGSISAESGCGPQLAVTGIEVAGTVTLNGGDGSLSSGGGAGGLFLITARGALTVSGTVTARGGSGAMGSGGRFPGSSLFGIPATVSANFTAAGGSGSTSGGNTDDIAILSVGTSSVTGTVTVTAGAGPTAETAGTQASVRIDTGSTCVTLD